MTAVPLAVTPILLIVEDHDMVRASLLDWLRVTFPAFDCREAQNGEDAVAMALAHPPAIILMDIGLPGMNGIEAARRIKTASPQTHVIMLSIHEDAHYRADAAAAGASAYVPKGRMHTDLIPIVKKLLPLIATMVLMILTGKGFPGG
jgi:DNA-binding NarL/FixJ family response regulator